MTSDQNLFSLASERYQELDVDVQGALDRLDQTRLWRTPGEAIISATEELTGCSAV